MSFIAQQPRKISTEWRHVHFQREGKNFLRKNYNYSQITMSEYIITVEMDHNIKTRQEKKGRGAFYGKTGKGIYSQRHVRAQEGVISRNSMQDSKKKNIKR